MKHFNLKCARNSNNASLKFHLQFKCGHSTESYSLVLLRGSFKIKYVTDILNWDHSNETEA